MAAAQDSCGGNYYFCAPPNEQGDVMEAACRCDGGYMCSDLTNCSDNPYCNFLTPPEYVNGAWRSRCCTRAKACTQDTLPASTCGLACSQPAQPCSDGKCQCGPEGQKLPTIGDPVNAATGESLLVESDLKVTGGPEPLELVRYFNSAVTAWALDGVVHRAPKPFGSSSTNPTSLHWSHSFYSAVRMAASRWTLVQGNGALTRFTPCSGVPCTAQPEGSSKSRRERLRRTATGFELLEAGGRRQVFEAKHMAAVPNSTSTELRYFLSRIVSAQGVTVAQLSYAAPPSLTCPQGATGSDAGVPYLASVSGPTGALDFQYAALTSSFGQTECVVRSVTRRGETAPSIIYAYATDSGNTERPGQVILATTASGARAYSYSSAALEVSVGSLLVVKHDYRSDGTASALTSPAEQLALGTSQASTCQPGSNCCGAQPRTRTVTDGSAGRGDGQSGAAGFSRTYETIANSAETVAPRLYQTSDSCSVTGACSPGSERSEWECATQTMPAHEKAWKNKRDAWEVYTHAAPSTGSGAPAHLLERTSIKRGAQDMQGTGALEEQYLTYSYGPGGEQQLASSEKPSVLGGTGQRARTFNRHDATGRLEATIHSGWTRVFDPGTGAWSSQQRWLATFYFTRRTGESTPDSLGRTLETHGPCWVSSESATDCAAGTVYPITQRFYWGDTETSARRNQLRKVSRYPAGLSSTPLETFFNAYDAAGNVTEMVDANGVTTLTTWRDAQLLTKTVRAPGQADAVTGYTYDEAGHLTAIQHPAGNNEVFCYRQDTRDAGGNPTAACTGGTVTDRLQWKAKSATADGLTWSEKVAYTYWPDGTVQEERYLDSAGSLRKRLAYAADAHRRPTWQQWGQGQGSYTSARSYDAADNLTGLGEAFNSPPAWCAVGPDGQPGSAACSALQYDRADRLIRVDEHPAAGATTRTCMRYDAHGNVTNVDPGLPATTDCETTTPSQHATRYQYDDFGRLVEVTTPALGNGSAGTVRYAHDAQGNPVVKQTPAMALVHARSHLAYAYDALSRLLSVTHVSPTLSGGAVGLYALGYDTSASLDPSCGSLTHTRGRLQYRDDSFGRTWFSYDAEGRTVKEVRLRQGTTACSAATLFQTPHTEYAYDVNGNLTQLKYPYGRVVTYTYGSGAFADRVSGVSVRTWSAGGPTTVELLSQVAWEPYGGVRGYRIHHTGSGALGSIEYVLGDNASQAPSGCPASPPSASSGDATGRIRALWVSTLPTGGSYTPGSGNGAVLKQLYTWQADQLVRSDSCLLGSSQARTETYAYDALLRLTGATGALATDGGAFASHSADHDGRGNRTQESRDSLSWTLAYSTPAHPDRLSYKKTTLPGGLLSRGYQYDRDGRVSYKTFSGHSGIAISSGPSPGGALDAVFKAANVNGLTYNYFYDAQGRRRLKDYPTGIKDEYFYDTEHGLLVDQGNTSLLATTTHPVDEYIWLDGRPVAIIRGKLDAAWAHLPDDTADCARNGDSVACGIRHLVTDYLGKPVLMLDDRGRVTGTGEYDTHGHVNRVSVDIETGHPYIGVSGNFSTVMRQPTSAGTSLQQRVLFDSLDLWTDANYCGELAQGHSDSVHIEDVGSQALLASLTAQHNGRVWTPWFTPGSQGVQASLGISNHGGCIVQWECTEEGEGSCTMLSCECPERWLKDEMGAVISAYEYRRFQTGAAPFWTPLRFPGQYHDAETDLFENWNRYYDPDIGRYLQPEPVVLFDPMMAAEPAYGYARNNPLFYTDPSGLIINARGSQSADSFVQGPCAIPDSFGAATCFSKFDISNMTECKLRDCGWGFDINVDFVISVTYRHANMPSRQQAGDPHGVTIKAHEQVHVADLFAGMGAINDATLTDAGGTLKTEGFKTSGECNIARRVIKSRIMRYKLQIEKQTSTTRDGYKKKKNGQQP